MARREGKETKDNKRMKVSTVKSAKKKPTRLPVPCCSCGRPTAMRVPADLLEEMHIWHMCTRCFRDDRAGDRSASEAGAGSSLS